MLSEQSPVDTIELLLREIAERLHKKAGEPRARHTHAIALAALCLAGCASSATPSYVPAAVDTRVIVADHGPDPVADECNTNAQCYADRPFCNPATHTCVACDGDVGSGTAHACYASVPFCSPSGACVECLDNLACSGVQQTCKSNACVACTFDSECSSGICHDDGTCAKMEVVVYVDHEHPCRDIVHASTAADPYCEIAPALAVSGETIVHLAASARPYGKVILSGKIEQDVAVLGPGAALATIAGDNDDGVAVLGESGHKVTLVVAGVTITSTGFSADAACNGKSDNAWLTLEDVVLRDGASYGIYGYGCHLAVRRSVVHHNAYGVVLASSLYSITRSFVAGNTSGGMRISGSEGTLQALSIVDNHAADGAAGFNCDTGGCAIEQSIIVGNSSLNAAGDAAQVSTSAVLSTCVLGAGSLRGLACTPDFAALDDPHLDMGHPDAAMQNQACVFGHGGSSELDVDGQPTGADPALGADQPL